MIKKWEIKEAPSKKISNRKILFVQCDELDDIKLLRKNFPGNFGVVFKSPDKNWQYAVFLYNTTSNILKLIEEEIKTPTPSQAVKKADKLKPEVSTETKKEEVKKEETKKPEGKVEEKKEEKVEKKEEKKEEKEKPEAKIEKFEKVEAPEEISKASPIIETFEKLTPDSEEVQPLKKPLIERFEEKLEEDKKPEKKEEAKKETQPISPRKGAKKISLFYLTPSQKKDLPKVVHQHIETIVSEKNINFVFENSGLLTYEPDDIDTEIVKKLLNRTYNFVIFVAPDEKGDGIVKELKKHQCPFKVITEDNIDKKFRYLNLITDIVLSPNK